MFVESEKQISDKLVDFGKIRVAQMGLEQVLGRELKEDVAEKIGEKVEGVSRGSAEWVEGWRN